MVLRAAWPIDVDRGDDGVLRQAEGERQLALRAVARPGMHRVPLLARRALDPHHGADAVAIRLHALRADVDEMVLVAPVIAKQVGGAAVGRYKYIEIAI